MTPRAGIITLIISYVERKAMMYQESAAVSSKNTAADHQDTVVDYHVITADHQKTAADYQSIAAEGQKTAADYPSVAAEGQNTTLDPSETYAYQIDTRTDSCDNHIDTTAQKKGKLPMEQLSAKPPCAVARMMHGDTSDDEAEVALSNVDFLLSEISHICRRSGNTAREIRQTAERSLLFAHKSLGATGS